MGFTWKPVKTEGAVRKQWGRPRKYSPDDLMTEAVAYFDKCDKTVVSTDPKTGLVVTKPKLISGFCAHLEVGLDYMNQLNPEEYGDVIKFVRGKVLEWIEEGILTGKYSSSAGIFNLKNHFAQTDKLQTDATVDNKITITFKE